MRHLKSKLFQAILFQFFSWIQRYTTATSHPICLVLGVVCEIITIISSYLSRQATKQFLRRLLCLLCFNVPVHQTNISIVQCVSGFSGSRAGIFILVSGQPSKPLWPSCIGRAVLSSRNSHINSTKRRPTWNLARENPGF